MELNDHWYAVQSVQFSSVNKSITAGLADGPCELRGRGRSCEVWRRGRSCELRGRGRSCELRGRGRLCELWRRG